MDITSNIRVVKTTARDHHQKLWESTAYWSTVTNKKELLRFKRDGEQKREWYLSSTSTASSFRDCRCWTSCCCWHDQNHVINFIGRDEVLLLTKEVLRFWPDVENFWDVIVQIFCLWDIISQPMVTLQIHIFDEKGVECINVSHDKTPIFLNLGFYL